MKFGPVIHAARHGRHPSFRFPMSHLRSASGLATPVLALAALAFAPFTPPARAEEGMWLYSAPPRAQLQADYGFDCTDAWLTHLMRSSVRFDGASASFVSGDGLVITNQHVGADAVQNLSSDEHNYTRDGFLARTASEELKCQDLELQVLQSTEDVTARVTAAIPADATGDEAALARRKICAEIESESRTATGLHGRIVTLHQGGQYHLYRYRRYTDVRLVFAPEEQIAFFGGDPDNFEFPRHGLDVCFFRVYEDGVPAKPAHFLKWSAAGAAEGELVFVSGHPGSTRRLFTVPELAYRRDTNLPFALQTLKRREVLLLSWSGRTLENARRARTMLLGVQNGRKVLDGQLAALQDAAFFGAKTTAEDDLKKRLAARGDGREVLAAYDRIAQAQKALSSIEVKRGLLESRYGFYSESFALARALLRAGDELPKPNGERLPEFSDAKRESLEQDLFADNPVYPDLEILTLGDSLTFLTEQLGAEYPLVRSVLAGKSPRARAAELIQGTRVRNVAFRRALYEGGAAAVTAAQDPMIELARLIDAEARAVRQIAEAQEEIKKQAHALVSQARFALEGANRYPDATGTLRLSYGTVKGYEENGGKIAATTDFAGLYRRSSGQLGRPPFDLPPRWSAKENAMNLAVPYNFVSTNDSVGGNSGSPVVNRAGEFVGILFDGNIHSLSSSFGYEAVRSRAISVHSAGILEALDKIYEASALVDELVHGRRPAE